eukprot:TRINITY_DN112586_c0_g1_i1.p1 TRINITY_DN112586_c0_g1~~TRINITY_DN112586_c0_g1_i1.p1  ORF type:complete len:153 (-),score=12.83 TRINITY_DN112586_c0_g1_i1:255-713(-)
MPIRVQLATFLYAVLRAGGCGLPNTPACVTAGVPVNIMSQAIVINLTDTVSQGLPVQLECHPQPHSTVLWRAEGYNETERKAVEDAVLQFKADQKVDNFSFTLTGRNSDSDSIEGRMFLLLWSHLKVLFKSIDHNERNCHVTLRCDNKSLLV